MVDQLVRKKVIGSGFFADVIRFEDSNGKRYAKKALKNKYIDNEVYAKRFIREIEILELMGGEENVMELIDYNKEELWYLMPEGNENLTDYIRKNNSNLNEGERIEIFKEIINGLTAAHSRDILHRDLAPNNVIKVNGKWCVSDFGLGKDYSKQTVGGYSSVQGYGNYLYTAPEQLDKLKDASVQSDIFSLGKILHFVLTGKKPTDLEDLSNYKPLISRATLQKVGSRYENISVFKKELEKYETIYKSLRTDNIGSSTIREYLYRGNVQWDEFYEVAMKAKVYEHIYYDFIDPIVDYLDSLSKIKTLNNHLGLERTLEFLKLFVDKLHECYVKVGWPFSALNSFGYFLKRFYLAIPENNQCQLECLKEIWELAAYHDQWAIQDLIIDMINKNQISKEIEHDFAVHMLETNKSFTKMNGFRLDQIQSSVIIRAIQTLRE